ncbi:MAG TPA: glutamyl-tRNA reductase, partial [Euzebya sp.]|nr:glutamyl-tRNA reductase [Euzebya sp.]
VDMLDRLAVSADLHAKALLSVTQRQHVLEAVVISTCNRVEVYANVTRYHGGMADLRDHFAEWAGLAPEAFSHLTYDRYDASAAEHLFAVASGLDSMVVGERQIHTQVRQAFATAMEEGTAGTLLNRVFRQAVRVGRRARAETAISEGAASIVDVALATARQSLHVDAPVVALVGAGRIGGMVATRVVEESATLLVTNRTTEKAEALAQRIGGTAHPLHDLPSVLRAADMVVSSTDSSQPVITTDALREAMAQRPGRPLVLVDLAVPRDVERGSHELSGVTVVDIEALRRVVTQGPTGDAIRDARAIVDEEAKAFAAWSRGVQAGPTIVSLRMQAEAVRQAELARVGNRLADLDEGQREAVEALTKGIVNTLLHQPTVRLKQLVDTPDGERFVRALTHLFDLDPDGHDDA